ncbi:hypothetical protein MPSEU_000405500 [Mayamaea pseudoterrestris]|nr:hypothetical protein MPSEU_000405500 [Mayamaea pseudoterrestris]
MANSISISDAFDGGNIKHVATTPDADTLNVSLHIKPDVYTELENIQHMQYFCFRAMINFTDSSNSSSSQQTVKYSIDNASKVSYPLAWTGSTVFYSTDYSNVDGWKRVKDTFYTEGCLWWEYTHQQQSESVVYFTYFPPYTYERHLQLINKCQAYAHVESLGQSPDGREIECVKVGTGDLVCWMIHRQHPGETMAEHYAEGLLNRLLGLETQGALDDQTKRLLGLYTFYIVPCMCPDGAVRGHLRTNGCGANLNREWANKSKYEAPTMQRSPEVIAVLSKMDQTGVDIFLDIHGDEELPYNFLSGAECIPKWGKRLESLHGAFCASYARANSDMQKTIGYPPSEEPEEVLKYMNVATNQVCNRFDCFGATLEMPFKDCLSNSDPDRGWSPLRSRQLGASVLDPLEYVHPYLRAEGEFWLSLSAEDAYVAPTDDYQDELPGASTEFKMLKKRFYSDVHEMHKPMCK